MLGNQGKVAHYATCGLFRVTCMYTHVAGWYNATVWHPSICHASIHSFQNTSPSSFLNWFLFWFPRMIRQHERFKTSSQNHENILYFDSDWGMRIKLNRILSFCFHHKLQICANLITKTNKYMKNPPWYSKCFFLISWPIWESCHVLIAMDTGLALHHGCSG